MFLFWGDPTKWGVGFLETHGWLLTWGLQKEACPWKLGCRDRLGLCKEDFGKAWCVVHLRDSGIWDLIKGLVV